MAIVQMKKLRLLAVRASKEELRKELISGGYVFQSETDTETVVHLLEHYYDGDIKAALMKTAARLEGSYALGVVCTDEPDALYVAREASPLILGIGVGENYFASDVTALVSHTKNVIYLEDGEFARLTPEAVTVFDCAGRAGIKPISRVTWSVEAAEKGGYEHFMLKEIMEQPAAVKAALAPRIHEGRVQLDGFALSGEELADIRKIIITACGSAYYAGCSGRYAIEKLCRIPVEVELASELRYLDPMVDGHTLVLVISQSGETADTIAALKECKAKGAAVLAIVNVVGSTIAKLADYVVYTWAGPEIAVATTKGYTTQLAVLDMIAIAMAKRLGTIDQARYNDLVDGLCALPERVQRALDMNHHAPKLAEQYYHKIEGIDGVELAAPQFYLASTSAGCCSVPVQIIGFDPALDFTVQPWIRESYTSSLGDGDIIVGSDLTVPKDGTLTFYNTPCRIVAQLDQTGTGLDTAVYTNVPTIKAMIRNADALGFHYLNGLDPDHAVSSVMIRVADGYDIQKVADDINIHVRRVEASAAMNNTRWPVSQDATGNGSGGSFDKAVAYLKRWMTERTAWMDGQYGMLPAADEGAKKQE